MADARARIARSSLGEVRAVACSARTGDGMDDVRAALSDLVRRFGSAIAVGIDARDGLAQVRGWVETTGVRAVDLARQVAEAGVKTIIYTDTATDGMLGGPNLEAMREMCLAVPECAVIASGGVSAPDQVAALAALDCANLYGAIVGKALYDGKTTLAALRAAG